MRGVYRANIKISGLNSARTLAYLTAAANKVVEILSARVGAESNATNQQLSVCLQKVNALGTPTGTTLTPTKCEQGDQAASSTVVGNVTAAEPTYVTNTQADLQGFASLAGYVHAPAPEERQVVAGGDTWGLRMLTASPTSFDADVELVWKEIG